MKNFLLCVIALFLLFTGCKENEPTAPENIETPPEVLAEATIGPDGGTLETEDFKLTIPSGAFDQSTNLKLYIEEVDSVSENSATHLYAIEGMPANYTQPLEVRIKYNKTPSGIIYIERGMEAEILDIDTVYTDVVYQLFDATEESGFLTTNLPPVLEKNNINKITNSENKVTIEGFLKGVLITSEHFTIKSVDFPVDEWSSQYQQVLEYFEASYNRFRDLDFDLSFSTWRKTITIKEEPVDLDNIKVYAGKISDELLIQSYPGLNISGYRYLCDPMLCFLILYAYEIPFEYEKVIFAISHWTKLKYDNYWKGLSSYIWIKYELMRSFNGNYLATTTTLSVLLEYLVEKYEDGILKNIMLEVKSGKDPILAIISQTQQPKNWLSDFYKSLLIGETWLNRIKLQNSNYSMVDFCKEYRAAEFGIEDTTTIIEWTDNYVDLSAKLYRVALLPGLNEESRLRFTVKGGDAEISLFRYKGSDIEFLSTSENADSVSNVQDLSINGYELLALVTNRLYNSAGTSDITLKIEQISEKPLPKITDCAIHFENIDVNRRTYREDGSYYDAVQEGYWGYFYTQPEPEPTFENNIFYQAYSYTDDDGNIYSGNFSIKFSDDLDTILTFSVYHMEDKTHVNPLYGTFEKGISGHDIPLVSSFEKDVYEVTGLEVCEKINNNIKASATRSGKSDWEIISIDKCRSDSRLWIEAFKK